MTNKKIEELLKIYEIDLHLLGKLHYDEFIEELETLLQKSNREAVRSFIDNCGSYVFGKALLKEKAGAYLELQQDKGNMLEDKIKEILYSDDGVPETWAGSKESIPEDARIKKFQDLIKLQKSK